MNRLNLENYHNQTSKIRRELLKGLTMEETFRAETRLDFARQLVNIIRKGGGPSYSPEYARQLEELRRELERFSSAPFLPPVPCLKTLGLLEEIAEMEAEEDA